jgi:hypothetical protein
MKIFFILYSLITEEKKIMKKKRSYFSTSYSLYSNVERKKQQYFSAL